MIEKVENQAKNIPYQHLLTKLVFSLLANAEKTFFSKLVFQYYICNYLFSDDNYVGYQFKMFIF